MNRTKAISLFGTGLLAMSLALGACGDDEETDEETPAEETEDGEATETTVAEEGEEMTETTVAADAEATTTVAG